MKPWLFPALAVLALLGAAPSWCDDTAIQAVGGTIAPMDEHPSVTMNKMLVSIALYSDRADVECTFLFHNTGKATTVRMGFPERGDIVPSSGQPLGFSTFVTWVDGIEVPTTIEGYRIEGDNILWRRWRVKSVPFAAGQTRTVRVHYTQPLGEVSDGSRYFEYTMHTGAFWKADIASCRVDLHLYYDPDRERFHVRPPLQQVAPDHFAFDRPAFEPDDRSNLRINYLPGFGRIIVNGRTLSLSEVGTPSPYIDDGTIWVSARSLARWIRADITAQPSHVILHRGTRTTTLWLRSPSMEHNGRRSLLPAPTRVEANRVIVPLHEVGSALGADVVYDPHARAVRITDFTLRHLEACLGPAPAPAALRAIPHAWALADPGDYDLDMLPYLREKGRDHPGLCAGDFNGDGRQDCALYLYHGELGGVALLLGSEDGTFYLRWLHPPGFRAPAEPGTRISLIQTRPPGLVEYLTDDAAETGQKSGRLQLLHDGIELVAWGKAAVMYYWDDQTAQYRKVLTAD